MEKTSKSYLDILEKKRPDQSNADYSEDNHKSERYQEIYAELKIKMSPLFDKDSKDDLGEMIKNLASFFSKRENYIVYPDFIKKYDKLRGKIFFTDAHKRDRLSAIEKALQYSNKKRE